MSEMMNCQASDCAEEMDMTPDAVENEGTVAEEVAEEVVAEEPATEEPVQEVVAEETAAEPVTEEAAEEVATEEAETSDAIALEDVMGALDELNVKVEQMNQLFTKKIQHTECEEKILDQMHKELQKYKDDLYAQLVRPILLDIIDIRDSIVRMSNTFAAKSEGERAVPLQTFSGYAFDMQDILEKNNIVIYDSKDGDDFTAIKQRIIKKVKTPVEELHGKVAESLSSGYEYMGRTISPEKVAVYIYEKPADEEGEN